MINMWICWSHTSLEQAQIFLFLWREECRKRVIPSYIPTGHFWAPPFHQQIPRSRNVSGLPCTKSAATQIPGFLCVSRHRAERWATLSYKRKMLSYVELHASPKRILLKWPWTIGHRNLRQHRQGLGYHYEPAVGTIKCDINPSYSFEHVLSRRKDFPTIEQGVLSNNTPWVEQQWIEFDLRAFG